MLPDDPFDKMKTPQDLADPLGCVGNFHWGATCSLDDCQVHLEGHDVPGLVVMALAHNAHVHGLGPEGGLTILNRLPLHLEILRDSDT